MKIVVVVALFFSINCFSQNSFYLGTGLIGTFAKTNSNNIDYINKNLSDFGIYYGNNIIINNIIKIGVEVFYLNNRVVLARDNNKKFELHQNLGFKFKPGIYFKKHSIFIDSGVLAVYVFDKDEILGNQFDHFDESYFYGLEYNYEFTDRVSVNSGILSSRFESISHYTEHTLKSFTTLHLAVHYYLH